MIRIVALDKIKDILARAMETICVVLIMALTILSIGAVFLRYAFDITFIQNEELITSWALFRCFKKKSMSMLLRFRMAYREWRESA